MKSGKQATLSIRWIAAFLILPATGASSGQTDNTELPAKPTAQAARPLRRTCADMDGRPFRWEWANVPFASTCRFDEDKPATPPQPQSTPK